MVAEQKQFALKIGKRQFVLSDLVFFAVFLAVACFFIVSAPYGLTVTDEVQYQFVCSRLMAGEKLFADNWLIMGMQTMFQYLPFRIYYALLGSVDGLVLAMRYVYVGIKLIFCAYVYLRLRKYGLWGVYAAVFFVGTDLFGIKTMNYYSISAQTVLLVGMLLFIKKDQNPICWCLAGFFFSCCVLASPPIAVLWLLYSVLVGFRVLIKKRERPFLEAYGFILSGKVWLYMMFGICVAAVLFLLLCIVFFTGSNFPAIISGIRSIFDFVSSGTVAGSTFLSVRLYKLSRYAEMMHPALLILSAIVFIGGLILRRFTEKAEKLCVVLLGFLCAGITIRLLLLPYKMVGDASGECGCHPLMPVLPALAAYVFSKNRNRRVFSFLILCMAVALVSDIFSNNSIGALMLPGCVPSVLLLREYWLEQRAVPNEEAKKNKKRKTKKQKNNEIVFRKVWCATACTLLVLFPVSEVWHYVYMARLHETERMFVRSEAPLDAAIESGVLKGVITTAELKENYEKSVRDAEKCRALCKQALLVIDYDTSVYVNAGVPVSTPFLHYLTYSWAREEAWWAAHPEKRPDVVYVPFFTLSYIPYESITPQEYISYFEQNADVTVTEGEIGYIVTVDSWNRS